jgi:hypothetical protein
MLKAKRRSELTMLPQEIPLLTETARRKIQEMKKEMLILKHEYPCQEI